MVFTNLIIKLQQQANKSTEWISDNGMVCSRGKTKLIIMASRDIRSSKIDSNMNFQVKVCDKVVSESADEKLLGVIISNDLTWRTHLYGNNLTGEDKLVGLITQLSKRVGILTRLSKILTPYQFSRVCDGIFTSKVSFQQISYSGSLT